MLVYWSLSGEFRFSLSSHHIFVPQGCPTHLAPWARSRPACCLWAVSWIVLLYLCTHECWQGNKYGTIYGKRLGWRDHWSITKTQCTKTEPKNPASINNMSTVSISTVHKYCTCQFEHDGIGNEMKKCTLHHDLGCYSYTLIVQQTVTTMFFRLNAHGLAS